MGAICLQIAQIPDLSLNRYQSIADTGVGGVLKRHESFLRQWHGIGMESNLSFHLLYSYLPYEPVGQRLKLFFIVQGNEQNLQQIAPLLPKAPLSEFFSFKWGEVPDICLKAGVTLAKKERLADIYNPMTGQSRAVHYVPKWKMNEDARLYDMFRIMEAVSQAYVPHEACAFRIDIYPVSTVLETRNNFNTVLRELRGEHDIKLLRETDSVKTDNYARDICREYEDWITDIETTPHFRVNMYGFAENILRAKVLLNAAASEALNKGDFSIAPIKADSAGTFSLLSRMGMKAEDYCFYPNQAVLKSWSTTYCLQEAVPFFRFPTLYEGEVIEIPKETAPISTDGEIYLGEDRNYRPVNIALKALTRHAFFTGMPGSGKTNTMLHLISQLRKSKIPFLTLESAKKEYRALLGYREMQDIFLFSPHLQSRFPLQINPMEFPVGIRLSEHINALLEVFEGTFVLEGPTYKFLSNSIQRAYTDLGWDIEEENVAEHELKFPSLQDVYDNLQQEIEKSSYDSELKGNLRAFLQVRLGGLMERDAGEIFNVSISTLKPGEWIKVSAIVELEVLGEQAKNFFVLLLSHYILETLRSEPSGGRDKNGRLLPVRHAVFIEEAHNIIAPSAQQLAADSVDPKVSATKYIVKMLAEVRALREAIIIADQLPTALASEVTKNTSLKMVHRLTAQDDREQIGASISASVLQLERIASFTSGQALIYYEQTMKPFEIQVAKWVAPEVSFDISNDMELYAQMWRLPTVQREVKVSFQNWQDKYLFPIKKKLLELQKRYRTAADFADCSCNIADRMVLLAKCKRLLKQCGRLRKLWLVAEDSEQLLYEEFEETVEYINKLIHSLDEMN